MEVPRRVRKLSFYYLNPDFSVIYAIKNRKNSQDSACAENRNLPCSAQIGQGYCPNRAIDLNRLFWIAEMLGETLKTRKSTGARASRFAVRAARKPRD
jgi:hypothetical protein